jgi:hypothetical protein
MMKVHLLGFADASGSGSQGGHDSMHFVGARRQSR